MKKLVLFILAIAFTMPTPVSARVLKKKSKPTAVVTKKKGKRRATSKKTITSDTDSALNREVDQLLSKPTDQETAHIEFNFENADLQNLLDYMAELFDISFLPDDAVKPIIQGGKGVSGNKVTFRTERPMNKKEVWSLFTTFLDVAGLAIAQTPQAGIFRVTSAPAINRMPLAAYIGTDPELLPDNDNHIRYVYFLKNASLDNIRPIIDQLRSTSSTLSAFVPLRAFIVTDKAYNIKALMKIVLELDRSTMPEIMSIIKLKHAAAEDIKKLYDELTKSDDQRGMVARIFGARRQTESFFFAENTKVVAEPRSNVVILFGTQETVKKIEDFISKIDAPTSEDVSPLYIYELQHTDATSIADILNKVCQYGIGTIAGQAGGVREGEKYFKPISFTPEKTGNRLIIKGDYEDYIKAKEIIDQIDVMQPEIALEVLIITVDATNTKKLGAALRNKTPNTIAPNVNFQTTGFNSQNAVVDPNTGSIMANLIGLATSADIGATLMSLGSTTNIWALFQAFSSLIDTTVVSNPFLVTTNKYKSTVSLGQTRRVVTSSVATGGETLKGEDDLSANLSVVLTPQINSDGIISLDILIDINEFTNPFNAFTPEVASNASRTLRHIETKAAIANKEILAIGGLIRTRIAENETKVPVLGDIPILGWLFKNKSKVTEKSNLLIFISPQIIQPKLAGGVNHYTNRKAEYSRKTIRASETPSSKRDPIQRWFFTEGKIVTQELDDFMVKKLHAQHEDMSNNHYYPNHTTSTDLPKKMGKVMITKPPTEPDIEVVRQEQINNQKLVNADNSEQVAHVNMSHKKNGKRSLANFLDSEVST